MSNRNSRLGKVTRRRIRSEQVKQPSSHVSVFVPLRRKSKAGVEYTLYKKVVDVKK